MKQRISADRVLYNLGKVIWIPVFILGYCFSHYVYKDYFENNDFLKCRFLGITGFPCPGCGGTRAVYYLFLGKFGYSFLYHPVVIYSLVAYFFFMCSFFVKYHIIRNIECKPIKVERYIYGFIVVLLLQWIFKLILVFIGVK